MSVQLDLLSWVKPRNVIVFPLCARRSLVRDFATTFRPLQPEPGMAYWRKVNADLVAHLDAIGTPPAEIERELAAFHAAVIAEVRWGEHEHRSGGDAA